MKAVLIIILIFLMHPTPEPTVRGYHSRVEVDGHIYPSDSVWYVTSKRYEYVYWIGADGIHYGTKTRRINQSKWNRN